MNLVDVVNKDFMAKNERELPPFRSGDTVNVHVKIVEGNKSRIQVFEGTCISIRNRNSINGSFRVRKISANGVGVERVFPFASPNVAKVELLEKGKSRRAKHFYLRERTGKKARVAIDYGRDE